MIVKLLENMQKPNKESNML